MTTPSSTKKIRVLPATIKCVVPAIRDIIIAQGIQFTNDKLHLNAATSTRIPECLMDTYAAMVGKRTDPSKPTARKLDGFPVAPYTGTEFVDDKLVKITDNKFTYSSTQQKVRYRVTIINKKSEFINALKNDQVIVIYGGHSRYGRGACFGRTGLPHTAGEWWGEGTNNDDGLFHMAYPIISISVEEFMEHGYTFKPCESTVKLQPSDLHPDIYNKKSNRFRYPLHKINLRDAIDIEERNHTNNYLSPSQSAASFVATKTYWGYKKKGKQHVLIYAGWETTTSNGNYLNKVDMKCQAFCHFGCSSFKHFQPILRNRKMWNKNPAYFTTASAYAMVHYWLYCLFKYDKISCAVPLETIMRDIVGKRNETDRTTVNGILNAIDAEEQSIKEMKLRKAQKYNKIESLRVLRPDENADKSFWESVYNMDWSFRVI